LAGVLRQARGSGVRYALAVAVDAASSQRLCDRFPSTGNLPGDPISVRATAGIHPNHIAKEPPGAWESVEALIRSGKAIALGETGLDRHWNDTPFDQQLEYFGRHLDLARAMDLPVVIHCREAVDDMVSFLRASWEKSGPVRGVMHSFSGDSSFAEVCLDLGLMISFSGVLTYKNAQNIRDVAKDLPHDRILVETDAPYLAPVPKRGKRNEPAFVAFTAMTLAELWGLTLEETSTITTQNALRLFRI
jgi:TatD DNase family protein